MCEHGRLEILWTSVACYRDRFLFGQFNILNPGPCVDKVQVLSCRKCTTCAAHQRLTTLKLFKEVAAVYSADHTNQKTDSLVKTWSQRLRFYWQVTTIKSNSICDIIVSETVVLAYAYIQPTFNLFWQCHVRWPSCVIQEKYVRQRHENRRDII
jgi:hypothetical protein